MRKLCVFLFVNCIFIFRIANTFVASYVMKYSEIFFVIRKFLAYTPQLYMLATALTIAKKIRKDAKESTPTILQPSTSSPVHHAEIPQWPVSPLVSNEQPRTKHSTTVST